MDAHERKYEALAQALGLDALKALVPFSAERIRQALAAGDQHLNTLPLASWDKCHGKETTKPEKCCACGQYKPVKPETQVVGVWALYVANIKRGGLREAGGWSLSNTVCVLKHVARYHIAPA
jgi:hypothetical protein